MAGRGAGRKSMEEFFRDRGLERSEFGQLALKFLEWLLVRGYSENTVEGRGKSLVHFFIWLETRGIREPQEVTRPIIERYQKYLYSYRNPQSGAPLSFRSQINRLVPIRVFFKWLTRQNYILYNPASEIDLPKVAQRVPRHVLTQKEAERVLAMPDVNEPLGLRDRAILETLYSTGMRRMELVKLKRYDLDAERGTVLIREGKGKKDRMVPVGERALFWLERYIMEVRAVFARDPDEGFIFLTPAGEFITPNRMTQLVRNHVKAADISKSGSCHLFRHTMATLMLENGADIRFIQAMLGHARLSTTEVYTQVSIRKLKQVHTMAHPGKLPERGGNADAIMEEGEERSEENGEGEENNVQ